MKLQSARDLKGELLRDVLTPFLDVMSRSVSARSEPGLARSARALGLDDSVLAVSAQRVESDVTLHRSIALGVAVKGNGFKLAVRVQRQALMDGPLMQRIRKAAKGEVDVRLIGRIDKRPAATARKAVMASPLAIAWYRKDQRPPLIGCSIGHFAITAGTLGAFVRWNNRLCVLSNNHVLANENAAREGDAILQRAVSDGGTLGANTVGWLAHFIPLQRNAPTLVDAAVARLDDRFFPAKPGLLKAIVSGKDRMISTATPDLLDVGDLVRKVGRTTGATRGRVTAIEMDNVVVKYDIGNVRFDDQVEIEGAGKQSFSDGGDSGSLIVNGRMAPVALLYAGSETGGTNGRGLTYAHPIVEVLNQLNATIVI